MSTLPKHNHPHTNIFVQTNLPKCRFKVKDRIYYIKDSIIRPADVSSLEYSEARKAWVVGTNKGFFVDKSGWAAHSYPYRKKINALKHLRKDLKTKIIIIQDEINQLEE